MSGVCGVDWGGLVCMKDPVPAEIAPYVLLGLLHGCEGICSACVGPEVSGKLAVGAGGALGNLVLGGGLPRHFTAATYCKPNKEKEGNKKVCKLRLRCER